MADLVDIGHGHLGLVVLLPVVPVELAEHELELVVAGGAVLRLGEAAGYRLGAALLPDHGLQSNHILSSEPRP